MHVSELFYSQAALYPGKKSVLLVWYEAGWTLLPTWTFWKIKIYFPCMESKPGLAFILLRK